jgi:transcriptional regulator with XRE-family HTH domain
MDNNIDLKQIGQRLRSTRLDRGLSQEDLSFESGIAVANISDIELGKKDIRISTFIHLIESLDVSADEILRANVPQVNALLQKEFATLLSDCSTDELTSIIELVKNIKKTWRTNNNNQ